MPLQSLRALCVIIVMLVHANHYSGLLHLHYLAASAVTTFLVLSGFIISKVYFDKINNKEELFIFFKKRFFRMYPMHLLLLLIFLIIEFVKLYLEKNYNINVNNNAFSTNNTLSFLSNFFLLNIFNHSVTFNIPAWTVSAEFLTSIFFGVICFGLKKNYLKSYFLLLTSFIIFFIFIFFQKNFITYNGIFALLSVIFCFIIGFFCFKIFISKNSLFIILSNNYVQILNLIILFLLNYFQILAFNFILPICCGVIIIYLCKIKQGNFFGKIFFSNSLIYIGKISYTLYMTHFLVYWIYTQIFRHILKLEETYSFENTLFIENHFMVYISKSLLFFVTTFLISHFLYNKFEKKFIQISHNKNLY